MALKFLDIFKPKADEKQLSLETAEILLRARSLQKQGHFGEAAVAYQSILQSDPDHWESLNAVAALVFQRGDLTEAVRAYTAVIERRRNHPEAYYKRGNAQNELGRLEAALA